ncbi:MAG TPA: class I SAM-dependent methyltransferase [Casimicrobium huifangae]|jgi:SAM-dependent methyltransferase|nr:class I SAM-dependent methyltransferase [Casimicrobium huifangae]HQA35708.1 class I SAM-dependent methyltransferase [Casimicrobium huifangae]
MNIHENHVRCFYDGLASSYHLLYENWEQAIEDQGGALSTLLKRYGVSPRMKILDAACGIGTQALGLAKSGYDVSASDISPAAVNRLNQELKKRALNARTCVDDLRVLRNAEPASFAAVLACDNSVPHLLSDSDILCAFRAIFQRLRPGGVFVMSVRDYAEIPRISPDVRPYGLRHVDGNRFFAVQIWEWEGDQYDLSIYLTTHFGDGRCTTEVLRSTYYAVTIDRLNSLLAEAGFVDTQRFDQLLFQPVIVTQRPNTSA